MPSRTVNPGLLLITGSVQVHQMLLTLPQPLPHRQVHNPPMQTLVWLLILPNIVNSCRSRIISPISRQFGRLWREGATNPIRTFPPKGTPHKLVETPSVIRIAPNGITIEDEIFNEVRRDSKVTCYEILPRIVPPTIKHSSGDFPPRRDMISP